MEGRCSASVPGGMLRVVVSAPICQNAIRQTMEALISTSRPIIFKWLLAEECNQSITDKILLKASLSLCLSLCHSVFHSSLALSCFSPNWDMISEAKLLSWGIFNASRRRWSMVLVKMGTAWTFWSSWELLNSIRPHVEAERDLILRAFVALSRHPWPLRKSESQIFLPQSYFSWTEVLSFPTLFLLSKDSEWQRLETRQLPPGDIIWMIFFGHQSRRILSERDWITVYKDEIKLFLIYNVMKAIIFLMAAIIS